MTSCHVKPFDCRRYAHRSRRQPRPSSSGIQRQIGSLSTTLSADKMNRCDRVWHSPWDLDSKKQFSDCGAKNCNDRYNLGIEYLRTRLRFPRIINWRRFSTSHRHGSPGESERAGAVRCAGADIGPADFASRIHHVGYGCSNEAGPMALVFRAYSADESCVRIDQ